ncbi:MAG TPA: glycosyltransferase family 87 protein [Candidatus Limnocylindrales bacterium]|nr:glycosyltransferase family 87 protein [Candidatus Limnocylindrales bacterium]
MTRILDHPAILPGLVVAGAVFVIFQIMGTAAGQPFAAYDVHSYWLAGGSDHPYAGTIASGFDDSVNLYKYRYPPPLAQIFVVLHLIPFPIVAGLWIGMLYAIALIIGGRWAPFVLLFPPTLAELYLGNVNLLIALAIVLGFRWPAAWAVVLLTKITPGVGVLWFAFRREWRSLAIALGATGAVMAVSFALAPNWWAEFREAMTVQAGAALDVPPAAIQIPLPIRLVVAVVVLAFGARTDRAWLVPVAATIAAPALWWNVLVILVACVPLLEGRGLSRPLIAPWPIRRERPAESTTAAHA